jgi:hypothetical protein
MCSDRDGFGVTLALPKIDWRDAEVFQLVGECYVHDMMNGEGLGDAVVNGEVNSESTQLERFVIR